MAREEPVVMSFYDDVCNFAGSAVDSVSSTVDAVEDTASSAAVARPRPVRLQPKGRQVNLQYAPAPV